MNLINSTWTKGRKIWECERCSVSDHLIISIIIYLNTGTNNAILFLLFIPLLQDIPNEIYPGKTYQIVHQLWRRKKRSKNASDISSILKVWNLLSPVSSIFHQSVKPNFVSQHLLLKFFRFKNCNVFAFLESERIFC